MAPPATSMAGAQSSSPSSHGHQQLKPFPCSPAARNQQPSPARPPLCAGASSPLMPPNYKPSSPYARARVIPPPASLLSIEPSLVSLPWWTLGARAPFSLLACCCTVPLVLARCSTKCATSHALQQLHPLPCVVIELRYCTSPMENNSPSASSARLAALALVLSQ
ncbi:hypothetical protein Zm00014a_042186 [Zea mays]|uniref:Uncharacterized protein n=1 Tax=Zea mays TaxID=4577 RepID=A0A3L6DX76_MAIZE|nr:hypothetical protein Zm00014a_042186 [Zea mays]